MKLSELKRIIDGINDRQNSYGDPNVMVQIKTSGSVGGTPCVEVMSLYTGFDWDSGKLIIQTKEPLMKVNQKTLDELRKEAEKIGWDMYEVRNLKTEVKRLKKIIKELNDEK